MPTILRRLAQPCLAALVAASAVMGAAAPALSRPIQTAPVPATVPLIPGADYDASVPTIASVLGYDSGARISRAADVRRYFEALRAAAPDRVAMGDYATTHEGRPVFWAAVGSAANIARLDQIKANSRALADARVTSPDRLVPTARCVLRTE